MSSGRSWKRSKEAQMRCRLKAGPAQGEEAGHPRTCSLALYLPPGVLVQTGETNIAGGPWMHPGHRASLGHTRAYFKSGRVEPLAHQLGRLRGSLMPPRRSHVALHVRLAGLCGSQHPTPPPRAPGSLLSPRLAWQHCSSL